MSVKEHYDNHLANIYSWMIGDFNNAQSDFQQLLKRLQIVPDRSKVAIDLGAGSGVQSVVLAKLGYFVKALDFNSQLLNELKQNSTGLSVKIYNDDIRNVK